MNWYIQERNEIVREYFSILAGGIENIPDFLYEYIQAPEMQRIGGIATNCGCQYTKIFHNKFFYSNLEHSFAVALIIWRFTKDRKQTLARLFHDIATPVFKHAIDFMNGDYQNQESTEALTTEIIRNSEQIMSLLKRDRIQLEEVDDYHIYPIADNDTPKLSADRLEYTLSNGMYFKEVWSLEQIKEMYNNIEVQENEEKIIELGFKDLIIAEKFIQGASRLWPLWISNEDKLTMQFWADLVKKMIEQNLLTQKELYRLSEAEVIHKIENCPDRKIAECYQKFHNTTQIGESDTKIQGKYCISVEGKRRYINPLVKTKEGYQRIDKISEQAKEIYKEWWSYKTKKYAYLEFEM